MSILLLYNTFIVHLPLSHLVLLLLREPLHFHFDSSCYAWMLEVWSTGIAWHLNDESFHLSLYFLKMLTLVSEHVDWPVTHLMWPMLFFKDVVSFLFGWLPFLSNVASRGMTHLSHFCRCQFEINEIKQIGILHCVCVCVVLMIWIYSISLSLQVLRFYKQIYAENVPKFPRMLVWDPYKRLGVTPDASEEEITSARNFLLQQYAGHERSSIEAAYEKILMASFKARRKKKLIWKAGWRKK